MDRPLANNVALITGASRGIGRAIALALAREGVHVALTARSSEALEETVMLCGEQGINALSIIADLSHAEETARIVGTTVAELGGIDILINNAGVFGHGAAHDADLEQWDRGIDINLRSLVHLTRHALPHIEKNRHGAVINIASISGKMSHPNAGIYCATKHAVVGFSGSVFEDVREKGIKVCAICPGFVNTDMVAGRGLVPEKAIQPEDIARTVLFVLRFPDTGCPTEIIVRPQRSPYA